MAGALGLTPDPATQPSTPSMAYASPPGGALTTIPLPGSSGYNPLSTALSVLQGMPQYGSASPQASDFRNKEYDVAGNLVGGANDIPGALSRVATARDAATQDKMASIRKAMTVLGGLNQNDAQMRSLALASGYGKPTQSGAFTESMGNASGSLLETLQKQREMERQSAIDQNSLAMTLAQLPQENAEAGAADVYKRVGEGVNLGQSAMMGDYRQGMVDTRNTANLVRLSSAEIGAQKNRFKYLGPSQNDPNTGVYQDTQAPPNSPNAFYAGPAIGAKPSAESVAQWKYNAWLGVHPGDKAGALDFIAGHKKLDPADIHKFALGQAQRELGQGADPSDIDARAQQIEGSFKGVGTAPAAGAHAPAPAAGGHQPPPPAGIPPRPQGVPGSASYSPSQKKWWWQENGQWKSS